ncbi:MAG TPA: tetratricopeptide repeat protein [Thermoanaerobaculia bacterium]|nr:tetratricopeptide repeat protein [Thermoanaerobaculia bacterium]
MPHRRRPGWAVFAGLAAVLLPIALYLPTLRFGFVFDDRPLLIENPVVRAPSGVGELFSTDLDPHARTSEAPTTNYLRPLFLGLAAGLYSLFRDAPLGWHAAAIVLHGLLGGLAFALLRKEGLGIGGALAAALLFSFHPAHVQSAAWVSGLQDLLFGALSLLAYLAYRTSAAKERPAATTLVALGVAYALALLAKEPAIGLLLFCAVEATGFFPSGVFPSDTAARRPRSELLVLGVVTAGYLVYRWQVLGSLAHRFPTAPSMPVALASVPIALLAYARDLLVPVDLFLLHPARPAPAVFSSASFGAAAVLLALLAGAFFGVRRRPALGRPLLWCAVWIAPVLALWAVNPEWMVMDRYLLLPSLGLAWAVAVLLPLEGGRRRLQIAFWAVLIAAGAALSLLAFRPFENEERFWAQAIRSDPGSATAWTEWARRRSEAGDFGAASEALERAIALDPRAQLPRLRRALLALRQGRAATAAAELENLVTRNPAYLPAWRNLVVARLRAGDGAGARATLGQALARFPADPLLWNQSAVLLRQEGRREEALAAIRRAIELDPDDGETRLKEALLLAELGRPDEAREAARGALGVLSLGREKAIDPGVRAELERLAR